MSDDEYDVGSCDATSPISPEASTEGVSAHIHNVLRCPECGHVFKVAFVDEAVKEKHQIHRGRTSRKCETPQLRERDEEIGRVFQVGRGSWYIA
jgi:uncharacterized Zn finger protein